MGKIKNILLSGYFGFGNFGDEAIFAVMKRRFERLGLNVFSLVKNPAVCHEFSRSHFKDVVKAIWSSDIVLNGGGGLLQDKTSMKSIVYYLSILFLSEKFHKKSVCFAQGIGPINKSLSKLLLRYVLNNADFITVRDKYSENVLRESGVTNKNLFVTADVAFLFDDEEEIFLPFENFILYSPGKAIRMPKKETLISVGRSIQKETGLPVIVVPFYPARDGALAKEVADELKAYFVIPEKIAQYPYIVKKSSFVVGMRYHSVLFSILKHRAFIGMPYDPKVKALTDEAGIKSIDSYENLNLHDFMEVFRYNFSHRDEIEEHLRSETTVFKKKAEENFELFRKKFLDRRDS